MIKPHTPHPEKSSKHLVNQFQFTRAILSVSQSVSQSVNQSVSQSVNQSTSQPVSQ